MIKIMERVKNRIYKDNGSITVETCIVLPIFISVVVTLMMLIKVTVVQSIIQHSINEAGKQISKYSYILVATGVKEDYDKISSKFSQNATEFNDNSEDISKGVTGISNLAGLGEQLKSGKVDKTIEGAKSNGQDIVNGKNAVNEIMKDPKATLVNFASVILDGASRKVNEKASKTLTKAITGTYISTDSMSADKRLRLLGVHGGFEGLDFSGSSIFADEGLEDIDIVVRYKLEVPVPLDVFPDFYFTQRSMNRGWLSGDASGKLKTKEDDAADPDKENSEDSNKDKDDSEKKQDEGKETKETKETDDKKVKMKKK